MKEDGQSGVDFGRLRAAIVSFVADLAGTSASDVDPALSFLECGLDSLRTVKLVQRLRDEFGCDLPTKGPWEHATIDALAQFLAFSAGQPHRAAGIASAPGDLAQGGFASLKKDPRSTAALSAHEPLGATFVFCGFGGNFAGMGRRLLEAEWAFRRAFDECEEIARAHGSWSFREELYRDEAASRLHGDERCDISLPMTIVFEIALAAWWKDRGVEPSAVIGHSVGEVAAVHCAGGLDLEDAVRVAVEIGRLYQISRTESDGLLALVPFGAERALALIQASGEAIELSGDNDPSSVTLSGQRGALRRVLQDLERRASIEARELASALTHCSLAHPYVSQWELEGIRSRPLTTPMYSTVLSRTCHGGDQFDGAYWVKNMTSPVLFRGGIERLAADGHRCFVEMGPSPVLSPTIRRTLRHTLGRQHRAAQVVASQSRGADPQRQLLSALDALVTFGAGVRGSSIASPR